MKHQVFWIKTVSLLIAVAALLGYQSVALEWQREEAANAEAVAKAEEHNARMNALYSDKKQSAGYLDGAYTGSGDGFGGTIEVKVIVTDSKIESIEITSASGEDAAYLNNAKGVIDEIIDAQSTEVDTVSGATFSSKGILAAVEDALKDAKQDTVIEDTISEEGGYADGTYTGSGDGFGGKIEVQVTVTDGKIASVDITSADGEDAAYLDNAKKLIDSVIKEQTTNVDIVSGATFSSNGIINAIKNALEGAAQ